MASYSLEFGLNAAVCRNTATWRIRVTEKDQRGGQRRDFKRRPFCFLEWFLVVVLFFSSLPSSGKGVANFFSSLLPLVWQKEREKEWVRAFEFGVHVCVWVRERERERKMGTSKSAGLLFFLCLLLSFQHIHAHTHLHAHVCTHSLSDDIKNKMQT